MTPAEKESVAVRREETRVMTRRLLLALQRQASNARDALTLDTPRPDFTLAYLDQTLRAIDEAFASKLCDWRLDD